MSRKPVLIQECGAGRIELRMEAEGLFLTAPQPKITPLDTRPIGVPLMPGAPLLRVDVGPVWVVGEVSDAQTLAALKPDTPGLGQWTDSVQATGLTVFARSGEGSSAIHVRSFAPAHGIPEDPVCGSGNISVAAYLRHLKRAETSYVARQGMQLGRDGRVAVRVGSEAIRIGGQCVTCITGTLPI